MANKNKIYNDPIFEQHDKVISEYGSALTDSMKEVNATINSSINSIKSLLGTAEEANQKFKINSQLEKKYEDFRLVVSDYDEKTKEIGEISKKIQNDLSITADELKEGISLLNEQYRLQKELDELKANRDSATEQSIIDHLNDLIAEKEHVFNDNEYKFTNSASLFKLKNEYDDVSSLNHDDLLTITEREREVSELLERTKNIETEFSNEIDKTNVKLEKREKVLHGSLAVMKEVFNVAKKIGKKWVEVDEVVTKYGRSVGMSSEQTKAYRKNVLDNFGQMAGRLGMTVQEIMKFQEQYAKNTGRAIILSNQQVESLAGLSKLTGEVAANTMASNMDGFGASVETASGYLAQAYARASQVGLNASKTSEAFANNIKMASKYTFKDGLNSISKMTMLSQRLKFNIESMSGALDKFSTIEGAISTSANIQLLGGAYANQFSNPMQAMGEALLDAEGFTNRIIDTFSSFAYFDKKKGMADMNAFEKQRMKLAAQELGINYDEAWNIAAQTAKSKAVDKELANSTLSQDNQEYLRNLAQYDTDKQSFYVTYYDENQKEQRKDIREIISDEQVEAIRRTDNKEDILRKDVHQIRDLLAEYVKDKVGETKTVTEIEKGVMERVQLGLANFANPVFSAGKNAINAFSESGTASFILGSALVGTGTLMRPLLPNTQDVIRDLVSGKRGKSTPTTISHPRTSNSSSSVIKGGVGRSIQRAGLKTLGKNGYQVAKVGAKALGTGLVVGLDVWNAVKSNKEYKQAESIIKNDSSLNREEKAKALYDAKKDKNKATGKAIGAVAGAAIGAFFGVPMIGAMLGGAAGGLIGGAVTKKPKGSGGTYNAMSASNNSQSSTTTNASGQTIANNMIETDVHNIYELLASGKLNKVVAYNSSYDNKYDYSVSNGEIVNRPMVISKPTVGTKTYIKEEKSSNNTLAFDKLNIEPLNLNVNGSIKLVGDKNVQASVDINKLLDDTKFKNELINIISDCLRTNTLTGRMVSSRNNSLT